MATSKRQPAAKRANSKRAAAQTASAEFVCPECGRTFTRAAALGALELGYGVCDLAEVPVDLIGVVAPARSREVVSLDEMPVQFQDAPPSKKSSEGARLTQIAASGTPRAPACRPAANRRVGTLHDGAAEGY